MIPSSIDHNISLLESGASLTEIEINLFHKIIAAGIEISESVICRCAGGWVRDKILGIQSDDIDICVEGCSSSKFGEILASQFPEGTTKIIIMQENPEQSKNMKTVRVCVFGDKWIDICELRGDEHSSTPLTDAQHRDFTINALFYNIQLSKVEDFVGGIADLKNGIIKTPLDPFLTFDEDPLRIIRAARFHAKFGYSYDEAIFDAARKHLQDFESKITRERVVAELTKIIEKNGILDFLNFLITINFFNAIFDPYHKFNIDPQEAKQRCEIILNRNPKLYQQSITFGAIFLPLYDYNEQQDPEHPKKKISAIEWAICRGMKMPLRIAEEAKILVMGSKLAIHLNLTRLFVGRWIRKVGMLWPYTKYLILDQKEYEKMDNLYNFIYKENLENIYELKPLINGKELADLLGVKPGKGFSLKVEELIDWQLENPDGTANDYKAYIKQKQ